MSGNAQQRRKQRRESDRWWRREWPDQDQLLVALGKAAMAGYPDGFCGKRTTTTTSDEGIWAEEKGRWSIIEGDVTLLWPSDQDSKTE